MSRHKLRTHTTPIDNLVANLRGEVGEVIATWTMMRHLMRQERQFASGNIAQDMRNQDAVFCAVLADKLSDELVARLSELAESKIGRLNFYFASTKLKALSTEVQNFQAFIHRHKFAEKRNYDISHKELPERWSEHRLRHIPYRSVLRGVALAAFVMKRIDRVVLGPSAKYLWHEMRKRRYSMMNPPKAAYMLLPYLKLPNQARARIIAEEMAEGREVWSEMTTVIDGHETKLNVCKTWGVILFGGGTIFLDTYPLQHVSEIKMGSMNRSTTPMLGKPIFEQLIQAHLEADFSSRTRAWY